EHQLLDRRPEFKMDDRKLLEKIDYEASTVDLEGQLYELKGTCFQTIQPDDPKKILEEEQKVIDSLMYSFQHSLRMQKHMTFLIEKGGMY
ncbi:fructose-bisphosphatase class III, partial [Streptococcus suis]